MVQSLLAPSRVSRRSRASSVRQRILLLSCSSLTVFCRRHEEFNLQSIPSFVAAPRLESAQENHIDATSDNTSIADNQKADEIVEESVSATEPSELKSGASLEVADGHKAL